jgi:ATPase subunit of ABC transporter with duplicated ATPase domains
MHTYILADFLTYVFISTGVSQALDDACIDKESRSELISELSASEKARLQLAVALVQSPDILLLDNPTKTKNGVFSDNDIKKIIEFILKFPKTCVVNSSDVDFLNSFSDNVLNVTEDGRVELFIGSYTSAQNTIDERSTGGEEKVTNSDVRFGLFLLFLLCPFEAMLFFYYQ